MSNFLAARPFRELLAARNAFSCGFEFRRHFGKFAELRHTLINRLVFATHEAIRPALLISCPRSAPACSKLRPENGLVRKEFDDPKSGRPTSPRARIGAGDIVVGSTFPAAFRAVQCATRKGRHAKRSLAAWKRQRSRTTGIC